MILFKNNFIFLCLVFFSIPFISCNDKSTEPEEPSGSEWVYAPPMESGWNCEDTRNSKYFALYAKSICKVRDLKYLGKSRCYGVGIEVLCGKK